MELIHYSERELEQMRERVASSALPRQEHLRACERCLYLLALVRRAHGSPSDEDREVTVDALRNWLGSEAGARTRSEGQSETDDRAG